MLGTSSIAYLFSWMPFTMYHWSPKACPTEHAIWFQEQWTSKKKKSNTKKPPQSLFNGTGYKIQVFSHRASHLNPDQVGSYVCWVTYMKRVLGFNPVPNGKMPKLLKRASQLAAPLAVRAPGRAGKVPRSQSPRLAPTGGLLGSGLKHTGDGDTG